MKVGSKEFEELQKTFEAQLKHIPVYVGANPIREKEMKGIFYTNGRINDLFHGYMAGYSLAKSLARIDALNLDE